MSFTSLPFFIFLLVSFAIYFLIPKKFQWIVTLVASYVFYIASGPLTSLLLIFTTVTTFYTGILMGKANDRYTRTLAEGVDTLTKEQKKQLKAENKKNKYKILAVALVINFGILAFLKYFNFFAISTNSLLSFLSIKAALPELNLLRPLGISFYTFQSAGYVIDVYRGKITPDKNIAKFALFVSYFPQIVQGPIGRYDELAGQLYEPHKFDTTQAKYGLQLMLWGLFKKLVIADRAAIIVNTVFDNYLEYEGLTIFIAVFLYCVQIYCDFSGGIDIARGIAQVMGINLRENFRRPFFATSISDFWRRWHISLSEWMRDYVFYPLSLSRSFVRLGKWSRKIFGNHLGKLVPTFLAMLITFLAVGIWHGANWKYVVYGLYNGTLIFAGILFDPFLSRIFTQDNAKITSFSWRLMKILGTTFLIVIGRYFSRAPDLMTALRMLKRTFRIFNPWVLTGEQFTRLGLNEKNLELLIVAMLVLLVVGILQEKGYKLREKISEQNIVFRWAIYFTAIFSILIFGIYGIEYVSSDFIYMGF
ncbi:MAG: MBOAT family protein [Chloroflexi bacterium]|nr:MBOAT family protein [Chloroflexota bacterium]